MVPEIAPTRLIRRLSGPSDNKAEAKQANAHIPMPPAKETVAIAPILYNSLSIRTVSCADVFTFCLLISLLLMIVPFFLSSVRVKRLSPILP